VATISKTKSGTWKAIIRKKGWPTTIKTFRTKRDATDWARRVEDEMVRGVYVDRAQAERLTLRDSLKRYLVEVSALKSPSTQIGEKRRANTLTRELGSYSLAAITPQIVAEYRDRRLNQTNRFGRNMSPNHVRLELALLSHLFTIAIKEWGLGVPQNPVALIRRPSLGKGRDRRLSRKEEIRLLNECRNYSNPMPYWAVMLALETAMRKTEIQTLTHQQIDLKKRLIYLPETKNGTVRIVPLTKLATSVLREATSKPIVFSDGEFVFEGEAEDPVTGRRKPYDFTEAWKIVRRRAGLVDLRFHDLRHEAVSRLVEAGLGDQEVAAISGHKSMQMLKRYTHLRAEDLVEKLDQVFQLREEQSL
jgi:integrase